MAAYLLGYAAAGLMSDAVILLAGVTLEGASFLVNDECRMKNVESESTLKIGNWKSEIGCFIVGLVLLLAFASWWHLDLARNFYPGTRWTGLWDNPNDYGMLMGAGVTWQ